MKYYVYMHYRSSDLAPFYVGKGSGNRAYKTSQRSEYWNRVFHKHGLIVKIINEYDNEIDAFNFEKYLITKLRNEGIRLANISDGGEGCSGVKDSEETKLKKSLAMIGNTNWKNAPLPPALRGSKNASFKGFVRATCIATGEVIILDGKLSSIDNRFDYRKVNACVNRKAKTHKGFTFERI